MGKGKALRKKRIEIFNVNYIEHKAEYIEYAKKCLTTRINKSSEIKNVLNENATKLFVKDFDMNVSFLDGDYSIIMEGYFYYPRIIAQRRIGAMFQMPQNDQLIVNTDKFTKSFISDCVKEAVQRFFVPISENNFTSPKSFRKCFGSYWNRECPTENVQDSYKMQDYIQAVNARHMKEILRDCQNIVKSIVKEKSKMRIRPEKFLTGKPENLTVNLKILTSFSVHVTLEMDVRYSPELNVHYKREINTESYFQSYFFTADDLTDAIANDVKTIAINGFEEIGNSIFVNVSTDNNFNFEQYVKPYDDAYQFAADSDKYVYGDLSSLKYVSPDSIVFMVWDNEPTLYFGSVNKAGKLVNLKYREYKENLKSPYTLRRKVLPKNVYEFADFCKLAAQLYDDKKPDDLKTLPRIGFVFDGQTVVKYNHHSKGCKIRNDEMFIGENTVRAELLKIFDVVWEEQRELENRGRVCIELIDNLKLSPIQVEMLKYISGRGCTWASDLTQNFSMIPMPKKDSLLYYLDKLCEKNINVSGKTIPLLETEWRRSGSHGGRKVDYVLYSLSDFIPKEVYSNLAKQPLQKKDYENLNVSSRNDYCVELCKSANTKDELWSCLQVIEKLPASALASIAKIPEVQEFFKKFTGEDAVYAAFLLQETQGCKKLANEMIKEKT